MKIRSRTTYHRLPLQNHVAHPFHSDVSISPCASRFPFRRDEELSPREEIGAPLAARGCSLAHSVRALAVRQREPRHYDWISPTNSASYTANTLDRHHLAGGSARVMDKDGVPVARARKIQMYRVVQLEDGWFPDEKTHWKYEKLLSLLMMSEAIR